MATLGSLIMNKIKEKLINNPSTLLLLLVLACYCTLSSKVLAAESGYLLDVTMDIIESEEDAESRLVSEIKIPRSAVRNAVGSNPTKNDDKTNTKNENREKSREQGQKRANEAKQRAKSAKEIRTREKENRDRKKDKNKDKNK